MDFRKLFLQIISILLVVVVVVCVGTAIKRSGEPEKEYDFSEHNNSFDTENWDDTEDVLDSTESDSESIDGDETVSTVPQNKIMYTTSAVNVRSGPGRGYDWLGRLELGASVTAVGEPVDEWQQVIYNGQTAYIAVEYLEVRDEDATTDTDGTDDGAGNAGTGAENTPGTTPGGTSTPGGATTPSTPVTPPTTPSEPSNPDTPSAPSEPSSPDTPSAPSEPETPDEPEDPSVPDEPSAPSEPETPDNPEEPSNPEDTPEI